MHIPEIHINSQQIHNRAIIAALIETNAFAPNLLINIINAKRSTNPSEVDEPARFWPKKKT